METLIHSFLVCGLSNALDGSEDDFVSNDIPQVNAAELEPSEEDDEREELEENEDVDELDPFSEDEDDAEA